MHAIYYFLIWIIKVYKMNFRMFKEDFVLHIWWANKIVIQSWELSLKVHTSFVHNCRLDWDFEDKTHNHCYRNPRLCRIFLWHERYGCLMSNNLLKLSKKIVLGVVLARPSKVKFLNNMISSNYFCRWSLHRCYVKEVFLKISQISQKNTDFGYVFDKVAGLKACNLITKRL